MMVNEGEGMKVFLFTVLITGLDVRKTSCF